MDVFVQEPLREDSPLRSAPNVILTPHLGASTAEAQVKVAEAIARQVVAFFSEGKILHAINLAVALTPELEPFAELSRMLGGMVSQTLAGPPESMKCIVRGKLASGDVHSLTVCALQGLLMNWHDETVNMVNAPIVAEERGISVTEEKSFDAIGYANLLRLEVKTNKGMHRAAGTVFEDRVLRLVEIDGFEIEIRPSGHLIMLFYPDKPGMVGKFGTILGNAGINIANMDVGRKEKRGRACVVLSVDEHVPPAILEQLKACTDSGEAYLIKA
jgi:D-3-phosphoglycerate dehydrogenase